MKGWKLMVVIVAVLGIVGFIACDNGSGTTVTPAVSSVSVSPATATVAKGGTQSFTATVIGTNDPAQTVTWSIVQTDKKPETTISSAGLLTVAADETLATLTVVATSTADTSKSGTAAVTVTNPLPRTLSGTISISPHIGVTINTELTATYSGTETVTYQWKKDGENVGGNSNKYTPTTAGSYTVTVSATGYNSKTSAAVDVSDPSLQTLSGTVSISPNSGVETGTELTATYSGSETVTYHWEKDGSTIGANSNKYTPTDAGNYTVTVRATGYNSKTSAAVTVTTAAAGPSDLAGTISISPNNNVQTGTELTATYSGSEAITYQWKKDGSNVGTNSNKYTPTAAGSYTVTVSATGYNSKTSSVVTVTVFVPVTEITGVPTTATVGVPLTLTGTVLPSNATNKTIRWSVKTGYGTIPNNTNLLTATEGNTVIVTATIANGEAQGVPYTEDFSISLKDFVPVEDITVIGIPTITYEIEPFTLSGTVTPENATYTDVTWSVKYGTAEITNNTLTTDAFGTVVVTATVANGTAQGQNFTKEFTSIFLSEGDFEAGENITNTFNVATSAEWDSAISTIIDGGNDKNYIINVTANFSIAGVTNYTFGNITGIKVAIRGEGKTLSLSSNGNLLRIAANQTVILRNLTLSGRSGNNASLVYIDHGTLEMKDDSKIRSNTYSSTGNSASSYGGGIYISSGTFIMHNGEISNNATTASATAISNAYCSGGGVYLSGGTFTMYGGKISGNRVSSTYGSAYSGYGGGVCVNAGGTFIMHGGEISDNTVAAEYDRRYGGGVCVSSGTFLINNGTILSNTATYGSALYGTAQRYIFNGDTWVSDGDLATTSNDTVRVVNGELVQ